MFHTIVLTVTDDEGATATDEVVVTVNAPVVVACSPISTLECSEIPVAVPFTLNFNGLEGGLEDNNTDQTGFTMVMHPSAPIADAGTPADSNVPGYVPAKLDINGGDLVITASKGLFYRDPSISNNTNSQINGMGVGVDASSGKLRFKTTIVNPAFNLSSNNSAQQAGIWFGIDEDNVVKVALAKTSNTTAKVQLAVEDYATDGNSSAPPEINSTDLAGNITTQSVTLILEIDQTTGQAQAFYQLNGGTEVLVENDDDNFLPLGAHFFTGTDHDASGATPNISFGGIYSSIRNASATPTIDFSFSDFSIEVPALSDQKDMLTFVLADQTGPATIDAGAATVAIEVDNGTGLTSLSPTITISDDATISPTSGTPQDFSSAVTYTVTAQDGSTKDWTVNVTEAALLSDQKDMLTFVLADQTGPAIIDAGAATVAIEVDNGTGLTSLSPTITISDDATISPTSGTPQDFSSAVTYTVTAQDGSTKDWTVNVTEAAAICSPISTLACSDIPVSVPFTLDFTGLEGGLEDNNADQTGFTMVMHPSAPIADAGAPADSNVPGYVPAKLDVNGGNLVITASKGLFYRDPSKSNNTNSQINGMGVGVNASSGKLRFKTTIVNPEFNLSTSNQCSAGRYLVGTDEDNVVKVALAKTSSTAAKVQLVVEDYVTDGNSSSPLKSIVLSCRKYYHPIRYPYSRD